MNWAPWSILVAFMILVWIVVYLREGSFSRATTGALIAGKATAVVYRIVGVDVTVAELYLIHRSGAVKVVEIHATDALLLAFAASLAATLAATYIRERLKLPRELRILEEQQR